MTALQKYRIIKNGIKIALPSAEKCRKEFWHEWKGLDHPEFMLRYGFAELAKYELLSAKQMREMERLDNSLAGIVDSDADDNLSDDADYVDLEYEDDEDDNDFIDDNDNEHGGWRGWRRRQRRRREGEGDFDEESKGEGNYIKDGEGWGRLK